MRRITARAPTRIDLAGGTIDLWPVYLLIAEAATVNVAIDLYAEAEIALGGRGVRLRSEDLGETVEGGSLEAVARQGRLELLTRILGYFGLTRGVSVTTRCAAPAGSGLGGSSALAVALCGAAARAAGARLSREKLLVVAKSLETRLLGVPTGDQDYIAALYGGLSAIRYEDAGVRREALAADLAGLGAAMTLVYTGLPHRSGINNWQVFRRVIEGEARVVRGLAEIGRLAARMAPQAAAGRWSRVGALAGAEGDLRAALWKGIATPEIRALRRRALALGAWGVKVCGAGGGGCVAILHPPPRGAAIRAAAEALGLRPLPVRPVGRGLRVREARGGS